jgi:predicted GIY-YIG superfamily endonuclease
MRRRGLLTALRGSGWQARGDFAYVYRLRSVRIPDEIYTGLTDDLGARLQKHNEGGVPHTAKYRPWQIESAHAFRSREKASAFERYLKTGSGREFARRHF